MQIPKNVIISRTDSIGDMVLTLPMAAVLKSHFPELIIGVMGNEYTRPVVQACSFVDVFIDKNDFLTKKILLKGHSPESIIHVLPRRELAKRAHELKINWRIGTRNRVYHWLTCNKLIALSRNQSPLHEAQLNLSLLKPFQIKSDWSLAEIAHLTTLNQLPLLSNQWRQYLEPSKFKLILHPKSRGSAREWDLSYFSELIKMLDADKFQIFISGTDNEKQALQPLLQDVGDRVTDISGQLNLTEFIAFLAACDGIIACSTGPLHLGAALQKHALGIYPPMHPIHPGRWQPIGTKARVFVLDKTCNTCRNTPSACACMRAIKPIELKLALDQIYSEEFVR
ncbi:glycosyltransferase family 9 protein [Methylocucumis oryzae]|uniref:Glycosyl transferase family 9 n=1 Tax=Methylocucumis oryzae TaxID=1632867 RepID=A0A0F3ILC6_9GAMM|nr:glycosyltransferase family 9 protein [Methylocucumis oryzae]KJV07536.1 glycosyl transferase family 9 [Methylocucumis oryzae]